jgi:hypothetical protein
VEVPMFWMLIAVAIIAVTTLAMTAFAMLFMRWMLGLDQFVLWYAKFNRHNSTLMKRLLLAPSREPVRTQNSLV